MPGASVHNDICSGKHNKHTQYVCNIQYEKQVKFLWLALLNLPKEEFCTLHLLLLPVSLSSGALVVH